MVREIKLAKPEFVGFRAIKGFNQDYWINEFGDIKSTKSKKIRLMKPKRDKDGYLTIGLSLNGKVYYHRIHRLVIQTFSDKFLDFDHDVHHKDSNILNNHISNLEIVTKAKHFGVIICPHCGEQVLMR